MFFSKFLRRSYYDWKKYDRKKKVLCQFFWPVFSSVAIFHILKNENYELCFLAGFFVDEIMMGKNYDRKKKLLCQFIWFCGEIVFCITYVYVCTQCTIQQSVFLLWFPPYLSRLQSNPPESNVEPVPTKSEPGYLRFSGSWLHIIFQRIVLEAAQIWQELAPHYFSADCFGGSSELVGTGSTLFSGGLFWRQLRRIVLGLISFRLKKFFWCSFQVLIDVLQFLPRVRFTQNHPIFTQN